MDLLLILQAKGLLTLLHDPISSMMLRYSFQMNEEAQTIEDAVEQVLNQNYHTADLYNKNGELVNTNEMTQLIVETIE